MLKLYLDTSVPGAYYDTSKPVRQLITQKWFEYETPEYDLHISNLTLEELSKISNAEKREAIKNWKSLEVRSMGTYKNDFKREEDEMLWELHEIRHKISEEHESMSIEEINDRAKKLWENIPKRHSHQVR